MEENLKSIVVVAVVATNKRTNLLCDRCLRSIRCQKRPVDSLIVVRDDFDEENDSFIKESNDKIQKSFPSSNLIILNNKRTRHVSGTGCWNTGIEHAYELYGEECFIAICDDDDEWHDNHVEACLNAINDASLPEDVQWIGSGLIRKVVKNDMDHHLKITN